MNLYERNKRVMDFFDEKIDTYDDVHREFMQSKKSLIDALNGDVKKVLDLGAGTGLELIYLFQKYPNCHVTVIDISKKMLDKLKQRDFANNVDTICGDFFKVPFGNDYDAVISTSALHHFKKEEKKVLYCKILGCLKENGYFINCDYIAQSQNIEDEQLYKLEHNFDDYKHIDIPLTVDHELEVLKETGFEDIATNNVDLERYKLIKARKL